MKKHMLILTHTFPLTPREATAHFMIDFAEGFADIGLNVTVLVPFHPLLKPKSFRRIRIIPFRYIWPDRFHLLGYGRTLQNDQTIRWASLFLFPFYLTSYAIALLRLLRKERFDVISAHWIVPNGLVAAPISYLTNTPLVITLPGSDVFIARLNPVFFALTRMAASAATRVASNSPRLLRDLGVKNGAVISYGVPVNSGRRTIRHTVRIATAGRLVEKKGFALLQKAYPDIEIISGLPSDQFRKKLLDVDIFIALSVRDSKGNLDDASLTVLEAMAAGCCVVTSDLPGYRCIIINGENGFLIQPEDENELITTVNKLKRSKKLRRRMGAAARRTMRTHFLPRHIAASYIRLLE